MKKYARIKTLLVVAVVAMFAGVCSLRAELVEGLAAKAQLESNMEGRLKAFLTSYLGTDSVIAIVKVQVESERATSRYFQDGSKFRAWDQKDDNVLPGVPAATLMTKKMASEEKRTRFDVAGISVSVFIGRSMSQPELDKTKELIVRLLGLNTAAGDSVAVESFGAARASVSWLGHLRAGDILAGIFIILLALFLFGPLRVFLNNFVEQLSLMAAAMRSAPAVSAADKEQSEELEALPALQPGGALPPAAGMPDTGLQDLVTDDTLEDVTAVLAQENTETIARIVQLLAPRYALAVVPAARRSEVLAQFAKPVIVDPAEIRAAVDRIRSRVAGSFGGPGKLARIVQTLDGPSRDGILAEVRARLPEFATAVDARLFHFEDLLNYDDTALRRIFRKAGTDAFVICMKGVTDQLDSRFYDKLGPSISELIRNRIKTPVVLAGGDAEAIMRVLGAVTILSRAGLIPALAQIKAHRP